MGTLLAQLPLNCRVLYIDIYRGETLRAEPTFEWVSTLYPRKYLSTPSSICSVFIRHIYWERTGAKRKQFLCNVDHLFGLTIPPPAPGLLPTFWRQAGSQKKSNCRTYPHVWAPVHIPILLPRLGKQVKWTILSYFHGKLKQTGPTDIFPLLNVKK